jgi:hypothetical protein
MLSRAGKLKVRALLSKLTNPNRYLPLPSTFNKSGINPIMLVNGTLEAKARFSMNAGVEATNLPEGSTCPSADVGLRTVWGARCLLPSSEPGRLTSAVTGIEPPRIHHEAAKHRNPLASREPSKPRRESVGSFKLFASKNR